MSEAGEVLLFWFGEDVPPGVGKFRKEWFEAAPTFDQEIRDRFLETHQRARQGMHDEWAKQSESALALVIVLDQFSRNMFRGTHHMFETDGKALSVARRALDDGFDRQLAANRRWFLYMPFMHSEALADQRRSVELFQADNPAQLKYAIGHKETIERFGRFPHRNEMLGRKSTPEELRFLRETDKRD